jgi:hypothetical protein
MNLSRFDKLMKFKSEQAFDEDDLLRYISDILKHFY